MGCLKKKNDIDCVDGRRAWRGGMSINKRIYIYIYMLLCIIDKYSDYEGWWLRLRIVVLLLHGLLLVIQVCCCFGKYISVVLSFLILIFLHSLLTRGWWLKRKWCANTMNEKKYILNRRGRVWDLGECLRSVSPSVCQPSVCQPSECQLKYLHHTIQYIKKMSLF